MQFIGQSGSAQEFDSLVRLKWRSRTERPPHKPGGKRRSRRRPSTAGGKEFGGLKLDQAKRLKELEKENAKLKRLVAELSLEKQILKDVARETSKP